MRGPAPSRPCDVAKKVRSERVNTRLRKTVDTAVTRLRGRRRGRATSPTSSPIELPETAEAV